MASDYIKRKYDVVVIGGGPAGSMAAMTLADNGIDTLLIEKRSEVGTPVRCAEALARQSFERVIKPRDRWIAQVVNGGYAHSPGGISVGREFKEVGYVLDRKIFDRDLFAIAAESGVNTIAKTEALGLINDNGYSRAVTIRDPQGNIRDIETEAVIAADGVESLIGRYAGIDTAIKPADSHTCAQYLVANAELTPPDAVHFYIGNSVAPGGYAWVFPKGNGMANVGLGCDPILLKKGENPFQFLDNFLRKTYPEVKVVEVHMGLVPASSSLKKFVKGNVALIGDAARHTDPFSGAGLIHALYSGKMAAEAILSGLDTGNIEKTLENEYQKAWRSEFTKRTDLYYKIRKVYRKLNDKEMEAVAETLVTLVKEMTELGVKDIFPTLLKALVTTPSLIAKTRHLII